MRRLLIPIGRRSVGGHTRGRGYSTNTCHFRVLKKVMLIWSLVDMMVSVLLSCAVVSVLLLFLGPIIVLLFQQPIKQLFDGWIGKNAKRVTHQL